MFISDLQYWNLLNTVQYLQNMYKDIHKICC
jgi:hypothetical protein